MKDGEEMTKFVQAYIHFKDECLKQYDTNVYVPGESFHYEQINISAGVKSKLSGREIGILTFS